MAAAEVASCGIKLFCFMRNTVGLLSLHHGHDAFSAVRDDVIELCKRTGWR